jgi:hypothetical protein
MGYGSRPLVPLEEHAEGGKVAPRAGRDLLHQSADGEGVQAPADAEGVETEGFQDATFSEVGRTKATALDSHG